ncbi:MAG: sugar ABC transporter ATP-binding protein, partial [Propionibacteriaceae bacterium]|nr:sugar ABC transporter ATP-binding protein [Propionibacteriaceae bacterium]
IYRLIRDLAQNGMSVIIICSEFSELSVCDRVAVMVEGRIVGEARGTQINEENLLNMCFKKGMATL